ncbi:MAG TPA: hypothetical protein VMU99_09875 [Acidimicrobiales bacterium]|nr:hypothetical protein [Acidimicrobiales bacterium]
MSLTAKDGEIHHVGDRPVLQLCTHPTARTSWSFAVTCNMQAALRTTSSIPGIFTARERTNSSHMHAGSDSTIALSSVGVGWHQSCRFPVGELGVALFADAQAALISETPVDLPS